jgi:hypothetical protein
VFLLNELMPGVRAYFVIDSVRKLLDTPSYVYMYACMPYTEASLVMIHRPFSYNVLATHLAVRLMLVHAVSQMSDQCDIS